MQRDPTLGNRPLQPRNRRFLRTTKNTMLNDAYYHIVTKDTKTREMWYSQNARITSKIAELAMMGFPSFCKSSLVGSILREALYSSTMILWVWATQMWPKHNKNNSPSVSNHLSNQKNASSLIPVLHAARMHCQGEQSSHICLPCSRSNVLQPLCHRCCLQLGVEKWKLWKTKTRENTWNTTQRGYGGYMLF